MRTSACVRDTVRHTTAERGFVLCSCETQVAGSLSLSREEAHHRPRFWPRGREERKEGCVGFVASRPSGGRRPFQHTALPHGDPLTCQRGPGRRETGRRVRAAPVHEEGLGHHRLPLPVPERGVTGANLPAVSVQLTRPERARQIRPCAGLCSCLRRPQRADRCAQCQRGPYRGVDPTPPRRVL